jgi:nucleoside triphosphatase
MAEQAFPEPTVGALVFNPEGKTFLMKSHKWKGKWIIPGGHIELGETIEEALKREIKEETGLDIFDMVFVGMQEFVFGKEFWKKKHFIFLNYACRTKTKEVVLDSEGQEFTWVAPKEALELDTDPYTRHLIEDFLKKFPEEF